MTFKDNLDKMEERKDKLNLKLNGIINNNQEIYSKTALDGDDKRERNDINIESNNSSSLLNLEE